MPFLPELEHYLLTRNIEYLDMKFKCFAMSLKYDARGWWDSFPVGSIFTSVDLKKQFFDRWKEKKILFR